MRTSLSGQKVVVVGLGKSGMAAARLLRREGASVTGVDQKTEAELGEQVTRLRDLGVRLAVGSVPPELLEGVDLLVVSPGVPLALPQIVRARAAGVRVWSEIELASRFVSEASWKIGITGTNGKSTTTALTGELFNRAGRRTFVGGNLGQPWSEAVLVDAPFEAHVIELSSFQLEATETLRLNGAAILNLTPDHLDRYRGLDEYRAAKERIFRNQHEGDFAIVNADDPQLLSLARSLRVPVYGFSMRGERDSSLASLAGGAFASAKGFRLFLSGGEPEHFTVGNRALRGPHNLQNAMAAALLARLSKVPAEALQLGLDSFPGLPHRLEWVRTLNGVEWINDSKATNVDSSVVALNALSAPIWLIAGGRGKGASYRPMVEAAKGKVKEVLTIGEDAPKIEAAFRSDFAVRACQTLDRAVQEAYHRATAGSVVLLSPACASFDQFKNFEHRGETFKILVKTLTSPLSLGEGGTSPLPLGEGRGEGNEHP